MDLVSSGINVKIALDKGRLELISELKEHNFIWENSEFIHNIFSNNFNIIIQEENNDRMIKRIFILISTLKRIETIRNKNQYNV